MALSRTSAVMLSCFGAAAVLGALVVAAALRQHKPEGPPPVLVGTTLAAAQPRPATAKPIAAPVDPAIVHPAAEPSPARQATPPMPAARDPAAAKAHMLALLRQAPHGTVTLSVEDDAEAQAYAQQLADLFRAAGWTVDESSTFGTGAPRRGLAAALGVSPSDEAVREAFDAIGFQFQPPPRDAGVIRTPEIFVGIPN